MLLDTLDAIEATPGRNDKEALLRAEPEQFLLQSIFQYALDPYRTYGFAKAPTCEARNLQREVNESSTIEKFMLFFGILDHIRSKKLTGHMARIALESKLVTMTVQEEKWAARILTKNLRCGISSETTEKLWPGLIPRFDVQLAESLKFSEAKDAKDLRPITKLTYPLWADAKLDGLRCVTFINADGTVELRSRNGQLYEDFPSIVETLKTLPKGLSVVLDCEILGDDWNETQSVAFSSKNKKDDSGLKLHVFDAVSIDEWKSRAPTVPYRDRLAWVKAFVGVTRSPKIVDVPGRIVNNDAEMLAFFVECLDKGYEGIMLKSLDAVYCFDRSSAVIKAKPCSTHEGKITGFFEGKAAGKRAGGLGGFFVKLPNGATTRVGGGFKDAQLKEFWERGESAMRGLIVEVKGQFLTGEGKIRFPRFVRFRNAADVAHDVNAIET